MARCASTKKSGTRSRKPAEVSLHQQDTKSSIYITCDFSCRCPLSKRCKMWSSKVCLPIPSLFFFRPGEGNPKAFSQGKTRVNSCIIGSDLLYIPIQLAVAPYGGTCIPERIAVLADRFNNDIAVVPHGETC
jgi:hypothetical protein